MKNKNISEEAKISRLWACFHRLPANEKDLIIDVSKLIFSNLKPKDGENIVSQTNIIKEKKL